MISHQNISLFIVSITEGTNHCLVSAKNLRQMWHSRFAVCISFTCLYKLLIAIYSFLMVSIEFVFSRQPARQHNLKDTNFLKPLARSSCHFLNAWTSQCKTKAHNLILDLTKNKHGMPRRQELCIVQLSETFCVKPLGD